MRGFTHEKRGGKRGCPGKKRCVEENREVLEVKTKNGARKAF